MIPEKMKNSAFVKLRVPNGLGSTGGKVSQSGRTKSDSNLKAVMGLGI